MRSEPSARPEVASGGRLLILGAGNDRAARGDVRAGRRCRGPPARASSPHSLGFARSLGFTNVWTEETLPRASWDGVIDASDSPALPARALDLVEPGGRVVYIGLAREASRIDTRTLALKDVTAVGILGGSQGLERAIEAYASGEVDPRPLIAATVELEDLARVLAGERPTAATDGPKIHVAIHDRAARRLAR